jgi:hypothetical protein
VEPESRRVGCQRVGSKLAANPFLHSLIETPTVRKRLRHGDSEAASCYLRCLLPRLDLIIGISAEHTFTVCKNDSVEIDKAANPFWNAIGNASDRTPAKAVRNEGDIPQILPLNQVS